VGIVIVEEDAAKLAEYATVSIAFEVAEILDETRMVTPVISPYEKDYDAIFGNHPLTWPRHFGQRTWRILAAYDGERRVGGAVVVAGVLAGEPATLWDIRVAPGRRGQGIGRVLLAAAEHWAITRGARRLRVETQNVNVPANRFYERTGFKLESVDIGAYLELAEEIRFIWEKTLEANDKDNGSSSLARIV
jgi:GNAT superfamily N-acetyltransferase